MLPSTPVFHSRIIVLLEKIVQLTFARTHPPLTKIAVERLFLKVPTFSLCSFTRQNSAGTVSALSKIAVERHIFLVPWRILFRVEHFFISEEGFFLFVSTGG